VSSRAATNALRRGKPIFRRIPDHPRRSARPGVPLHAINEQTGPRLYSRPPRPIDRPRCDHIILRRVASLSSRSNAGPPSPPLRISFRVPYASACYCAYDRSSVPKMIGMVLVTYGRLAAELVAALELAAGPQTEIAAICIGPDDDMEERREDILHSIAEVNSGDGALLLTDMFGGTPSNLAISMMDRGKIEVIAGVNLPMLIKLASLRQTESLERTVLGGQEAGRKYINVASQLLAEARKRPKKTNKTSNLSDPQKTRGVPKTLKPVRTKIGKAILDNQQQIMLATAALSVQFDEKLASLRAALPNSGVSQRERDAQIANYEQLKESLEKFRVSSIEFCTGSGKEANVVKSSKTFSDGISAWWTKHHEKICERTLDVTIFLSSVLVCSAAGAGGPLSVLISSALVGRKSIVDALRSVGKVLPKVRISE
jgi:PTS system mannose-specific IIA component